MLKLTPEVVEITNALFINPMTSAGLSRCRKETLPLSRFFSWAQPTPAAAAVLGMRTFFLAFFHPLAYARVLLKIFPISPGMLIGRETTVDDERKILVTSNGKSLTFLFFLFLLLVLLISFKFFFCFLPLCFFTLCYGNAPDVNSKTAIVLLLLSIRMSPALNIIFPADFHFSFFFLVSLIIRDDGGID